MKTIIMDSKNILNLIEKDLKKYTSKFNNIKLAVFKINDDKATEIYINNKIKKCNQYGIETIIFKYDSNIDEETIIKDIEKCNEDKKITGIMVELPIYKNLNQRKIINSINPIKDVDGLTDINMNKLVNNESCFVPCTVSGIEKILDYYNINIYEKNITIINRSNLIGIPLFFRLLNRDCTVTVCHSKTSNIETICKNSDIIVSAVGKRNFIDENYINEKSIVIDAGITTENNKVYGDVNFEAVINKCAYLTKVPGCVGPMTVISLIENLYLAYCMQNGDDENE